jgi:hypothetical protein
MDPKGPTVVWQPAARFNYDDSWNRCFSLPVSIKIKFQAKPNAPEICLFASSFLRDAGTLAPSPALAGFL